MQGTRYGEERASKLYGTDPMEVRGLEDDDAALLTKVVQKASAREESFRLGLDRFSPPTHSTAQEGGSMVMTFKSSGSLNLFGLFLPPRFLLY